VTDRHLRISTLLLLGVAGCAPIGLETPEPEPTVPEVTPAVEAPPPPAPSGVVPSFDMNAPVVGVRSNRSPINLAVNESVSLDALGLAAVDASGSVVEGAVFSTAVPRGNAASLSSSGALTGLREGETQLVLTVMTPGAGGLPEARVFPIPVVVRGGLVRFLQVATQEYAVYAGTAVPFEVEARTARGELREQIEVVWTSRNPEIASVSRAGLVRGLRPGSATLVASAEGMETAHVLQVLPNPVRAVELTPDNASVRTGDVVRFAAVARNARGGPVRDIALTYAVGGEGSAPEIGATVDANGSFVAERPGRYRVVANAGGTAADAVVEVRARAVARRPEGLSTFRPVRAGGQLRVFRGLDGRDYAYVGATAMASPSPDAAAAGLAIPASVIEVWDVTAPESPFLVDAVTVIGAELTDLEVSANAGFAVLTQRGPDGMGGFAVLDLADPAHPFVKSAYPTDLPGGIRDASIANSLVYLIAYDAPEVAVFDVANSTFPVEVGGWATERPGRILNGIHVSGGLAYLAAGADGVWILDVGDGRWGGAPATPALVTSYAYPGGHAATAFPYQNADGRAYVFVGDRLGSVRVLSSEDPETPVEVARYEVPEAGVQGFHVVGDQLRAAYGQAGLRVVDVSGELRGDLYRQGREIASFSTGHPAGTPPNTPLASDAHAQGGTIFVSDESSGVWAIRLEAPRAGEAGGG